MGSIGQQPTIAQNQGQSHSQSPQNQYGQGNQMGNNEANFKKNRTTAQSASTQSNNSINQIPQQTIAGTGSGYNPGSNPVIQQQPTQQPSISNPNQSLTTSQANKISEEHKSILEGVKLGM